MVKKTRLGNHLYVHGFDLSSDAGSIDNCAGPSVLLDVTGIIKLARERIFGPEDGEISFSCFFNKATDQEHDALSGLVKTDRLVMWLIGTTRGDQVACLLGKQINYDWNRNADMSLVGTVQVLGQGNAREWARLLVAKVTHASATDETGVNEPSDAQTTAGAVGFLQHFSAATGTVEYDIEDSSDSTNGIDGAWANLLAFSDVATPYTQIAERVAVAGNVEKWVRASTNGTFTTAVFSMAFKRN